MDSTEEFCEGSGAIASEGRRSLDSRGDKAGMLIAALCFVHCVAGPVLLSVAGFASLVGVSEKLEPLFLLSSLAMGVAALIPGYRRKHGRLSCLAMFCTGIVCLMLRHHIRSSLPMESIGTGVGACLIAGAHGLNHKLTQRCRCCDPTPASDRAEMDEDSRVTSPAGVIADPRSDA